VTMMMMMMMTMMMMEIDLSHSIFHFPVLLCIWFRSRGDQPIMPTLRVLMRRQFRLHHSGSRNPSGFMAGKGRNRHPILFF